MGVDDIHIVVGTAVDVANRDALLKMPASCTAAIVATHDFEKTEKANNTDNAKTGKLWKTLQK